MDLFAPDWDAEGALPMTEDSLLELLRSADHDYLSLDEVATLSVVPGLVLQSKEATLSALAELFREGLVAPGDLLSPGFVAWAGYAEEWIARAQDEIERLPWLPMGAGFWMDLTTRGTQRLEQLQQNY